MAVSKSLLLVDFQKILLKGFIWMKKKTKPNKTAQKINMYALLQSIHYTLNGA